MVNQDIDELTHDHVFLGASHDDNARRTRWVVVLTTIAMVGEIVAGWQTGSMALLADGFYMATHAVALGIVAAAYGFARRHAANPRFSFGTGKVGDLAGFASAMVLGLIAFGIGLESAQRLFEPVAVAFPTATWIAVLGLAVNLGSAFLLGGGHEHGHSHASDGHRHDHDHHHGHAPAGRDNNLRSAYVHVLADALTSVLAICALLAGRYLGWVWMDPAVGVLGAVVIARWSWMLLRDTAAVLLDVTHDGIAEEVRKLVEDPGDAHITDLHVWRIGPQAHAAIVGVTGATDGRSIRRRLDRVPGLEHLTVEVR